MVPTNDLQGIYDKESHNENPHVVMFLLIKPSDENADNYIKKFNYWHNRSGEYCNIYLIGYSECYSYAYPDVIEVEGIGGSKLYYSDKCFCSVTDQLDSQLKNWKYSGEPELIILQNRINTYGKNTLDFSYYNYIDINYGIRKKYIESFPRFMEAIINASRFEVESINALKRAQRRKIVPRRIVEYAIDNTPKLPIPIKKILRDKMFFKTYKSTV
jgi:hypothetical protein